MNEQNSGEGFRRLDVFDRTEKDTNGPAANMDPLAHEVPVEAAILNGAPEVPVNAAIAAVGPTDETVVHEAPMPQAIPYRTMLVEPLADESGVSKSIPDTAPVGEIITHEAPVGMKTGLSAALLDREDSEHFRTRWNEIQGGFVDEPRSAVQQADALVTEVVEQITHMFADERTSLESQWNQGNDVSTEDLRKALQRYRSFFNRLVV